MGFLSKWFGGDKKEKQNSLPINKISGQTALKMEDEVLAPLACKNKNCETMKQALQKATDFFVESDRLHVENAPEGDNNK